MSTSRGVLVLDEALQSLRPHLEKRNFIVFSRPPAWEEATLGLWLAHRVFITGTKETVEALRESGAIHEFSIIDASGVDEDAAALAKSISSAWSGMRLNRIQPFVLRLLTERMGSPEPLE
jgi:hypothetical protein